MNAEPSVTLFVPTANLSAEGAELTESSGGGLLSAALDLIDPAISFTIADTDNEKVPDGVGWERLSIDSGAEEGAGVVELEELGTFNLIAPALAAQRADFSENGNEESSVAAFAETFQKSATGAMSLGAGEQIIPLVSLSDDGESFSFVALWLVRDEDSERLAVQLPESFHWMQGDAAGGRGLKEIALSAVLGLSVPLSSIETYAATDSAAEVVGGVMAPDNAATWEQLPAPNDEQDGARIERVRLARANKENSRIVVDVEAQRLYVFVEGALAMDAPASTARKGKHTPRGVFKITQRVREGKISTIYKVELPRWMRLNQSAIGIHVGALPGEPASAGCIRLQEDVATILFDHTESGIVVEVVDAYQVPQLAAK